MCFKCNELLFILILHPLIFLQGGNKGQKKKTYIHNAKYGIKKMIMMTSIRRENEKHYHCIG